MPSGQPEITLRFLASPHRRRLLRRGERRRVLEWIDKAGLCRAVGWSGRYCVTAYVGNVQFSRPVAVGELVEATARLVHTGRSSMHILVSVRSGDPQTAQLSSATECLMVFVAVDGDGRPVEVPAFEPQTEADSARAGARRAADRPAARDRERDGGPDLQRPRDGAAGRAALPCCPHRCELGRKGARRHRHAVDRRGRTCSPTRWTGSAANVAVYAGGVRFYRPLRIGHLVEVDARLLHTGSSSLHISVHVRSGDPATADMDLTTHCLIVFVPLTPDGRAAPAPAWVPVSEEDAALERHALHLIDLRKTVPRSARPDG